MSYEGAPTSGTFAEAGVVEIAPGKETTFESRFALSFAIKPTPDDLIAGRVEPYRYAWVFDVPDGERPEQWLSGTIISEPVEWRMPVLHGERHGE